MKTCLLCGSDVEDDVPTCPSDGEASFAPADDGAQEDLSSAPGEAAPRKRSRK